MSFDAFFERATERIAEQQGAAIVQGLHPYAWQTHAAEDGLPDLVAVPTGMGKTEGVVLAWAWRALVRKDATEPRHLAYCLPMRVLVRQTAERLKECFRRLHHYDHELDVGVFTLMGGQADDEWAGCPDRPWVLIGTQDQLLSRALNRGYAMSPFDWPVHFGLLNNDCRWERLTQDDFHPSSSAVSPSSASDPSPVQHALRYADGPPSARCDPNLTTGDWSGADRR